MGSILQLNSTQQERAEELLARLDSESEPMDLVSTWKSPPNRVGYNSRTKNGVYIQTCDIVGTEEHNLDRLEWKRVERVVEKMLYGEFEKEHQFPPALCKIGDEYFVEADGNHRALAYKYIGIEQMYADVTIYNK